MAGAEVLAIAKIAGPAMSVSLRTIQPYVATGLNRRYRKRLKKALEGALADNAPDSNGSSTEEGDGWLKRTVAKGMTRLPWRKGESGARVESQEIMNAIRGAGAERSGLGIVSRAEDGRFHWRERFAKALAALATQGTGGEEAEAWKNLIGNQAISEWAEAVSLDFAMRIRADAHLTLVVAQLEEEDGRAGLAVGMRIAQQFVLAVGFLGVSLVLTGGLLALAIVHG